MEKKSIHAKLQPKIQSLLRLTWLNKPKFNIHFTPTWSNIRRYCTTRADRHRKPNEIALRSLSDSVGVFDVLSTILLSSNRKDQVFCRLGKPSCRTAAWGSGWSNYYLPDPACLLLCSLPANWGKQIPGKQPLPPECSVKSFDIILS